jgi:hypothetical protein
MCMLVPLWAPACASDRDAVSRQLLAVTHHVGAPDGMLAIDEEGRWNFVDSAAKTETKGVLSSAELAELKVRLERPRLEALYAEKSQDDDRCGQLEDGYILISKVSVGCFVMSDELTATTREDLSYFVGVFNDHSSKN